MNNFFPIYVSSTINSPTILQKAKDLSLNLGIPFLPSASLPHQGIVLAYTEIGLQLLSRKKSGKVQTLLHIDFIGGKNGYRHRKNLTIKQSLARAAGIRPGVRPFVLDATAGLGSDSFVLACLGCTVHMLERSPVLHALLEDGLNRAAQHPKTEHIIRKRMHLFHEDTVSYLQKTTAVYDTIYLDPMYPHRTGTALNRQSMRIIRDLVGNDEDSSSLLETARTKAKKRVSVKRPKGAEHLAQRSPSFMIKTKNSRYDIYLMSS
ncbi:class I SAM-dependent methyltransferase [Desulfomarina sp.]